MFYIIFVNNRKYKRIKKKNITKNILLTNKKLTKLYKMNNIEKLDKMDKIWQINIKKNLGRFLPKYLHTMKHKSLIRLLCIRRKKGQTIRRIANSRLLTFSPSCFDFFIMIWVAVTKPLISWKAEKKKSVRRRKTENAIA